MSSRKLTIDLGLNGFREVLRDLVGIEKVANSLRQPIKIQFEGGNQSLNATLKLETGDLTRENQRHIAELQRTQNQYLQNLERVLRADAARSRPSSPGSGPLGMVGGGIGFGFQSAAFGFFSRLGESLMDDFAKGVSSGLQSGSNSDFGELGRRFGEFVGSQFRRGVESATRNQPPGQSPPAAGGGGQPAPRPPQPNRPSGGAGGVGQPTQPTPPPPSPVTAYRPVFATQPTLSTPQQPGGAIVPMAQSGGAITPREPLLAQLTRLMPERSDIANAWEQIKAVDQKARQVTQSVISSGRQARQVADSLLNSVRQLMPGRDIADAAELSGKELSKRYKKYLQELIEASKNNAEQQLSALIPNADRFTIDELRNLFSTTREGKVPSALGAKMASFRAAVREGRTEVAKKLGETLLAEIQSSRKIVDEIFEQVRDERPLTAPSYRKAAQGTLSRMENEILRGDKGKGRTERGLENLSETSPAFQRLLDRQFGRRSSNSDAGFFMLPGQEFLVNLRENIASTWKQMFPGNQRTSSQGRADKFINEKVAGPATKAVDGFLDFFTLIEQKIPIIGDLKQVFVELFVQLVAALAIGALVSVLGQLSTASGDTARKFNQLERSIRTLSSGQVAGQRNIEAASEISNKLGALLVPTLEGQVGFVAANRGTALEGDQSNRILEAFLQAGVAIGQNSDEQRLMLKGLRDAFGKGVLTKEEARGQIAEVLPQFMPALQSALGLTQQQLEERFRAGIPVAEVLPIVATQLQAQAAAGTVNAGGVDVQRASNFRQNQQDLLLNTLGQQILPLQQLVDNTLGKVFEFVNTQAELLDKLLDGLIPAAQMFLITVPGQALWNKLGLKLILSGALDMLVKALPMLRQFVIQWALFTLAIEAAQNVARLLGSNFEELDKSIEGSINRAQQLEKAFAAVRDTGAQINPNLAQTDKDLRLNEGPEAFGLRFNLDNLARRPLQQLQQFLSKQTGIPIWLPMITEAERRQADFLNRQASLGTQQNNLLIQRPNIDKNLQQVLRIDQQLEGVRSARNTITSGDREALQASYASEQKLIAERDKYFKAVAVYNESLAAEIATNQRELENLGKMLASGEITQANEQQVRAQLEDRLRLLQLSQKQINDLMGGLQRQLGVVDRQLRTLAESATAFKESLELDLGQRRRETIEKALANGLSSEEIQAALETVATDGLQKTVDALATQINGLNQYLNSPELSAALARLKEQANQQGVPLENSATLERFAGEQRSETERATIRYLQQLLQARRELTQTEEQIAQRRQALIERQRQVGKSIADYLFRLDQQLKETLIEIDRLNQQVGFGNLKNRLSATLKGGVDNVFSSIVNTYQGLLDQLAGLSDRSAQDLKNRLGLETEQRTLAQEAEELRKQFAALSSEIAGFRQQLGAPQPGSAAQGLPVVNAANLLPVPKIPIPLGRAPQGTLPPPPPIGMVLPTPAQIRSSIGGAFTPPAGLQGLSGISRSLLQDAPGAFNTQTPEGRARLAIAMGIAGTEATDWLRGALHPSQIYSAMGGALKNGKPNMRGPFQFNMDYWSRQASTQQGQNQFLGQILSGQTRTPDSKQQRDFGAELVGLLNSGAISNPQQLEQWMSRTLGYGGGGRNWQGLTDGWGRTNGLSSSLFGFLSQNRAPAGGLPMPPRTPGQIPAATIENYLPNFLRGLAPQPAAQPATPQPTTPAGPPPGVREAQERLNQAKQEQLRIEGELTEQQREQAKIIADQAVESTMAAVRQDLQQQSRQVVGLTEQLQDLSREYKLPTLDLTEQADLETVNRRFRDFGNQIADQIREMEAKLESGRRAAEAFTKTANELAASQDPIVRAAASSVAIAQQTISSNLIQQQQQLAQLKQLQQGLPAQQAAAQQFTQGQSARRRTEDSFRIEEFRSRLEAGFLEGRAQLAESAGFDFDAAALRERAALMQENIRLQGELLQIQREFAAQPGIAAEMEKLARAQSEVNIANIQNQFKGLGETLKDVTSNSLEQFFGNLFSGSMSAGQAFRQFTLSILQGLAQIAAKMLTARIFSLGSRLFGGLFGGGGGGGGFLGDALQGGGGLFGAFNAAYGGEAQVGQTPLGEAISREKLLSGGRPVALGVFTVGEQILSVITGEAQRYQQLERQFGQNPLAKVLGNFAMGGPVEDRVLASLNSAPYMPILNMDMDTQNYSASSFTPPTHVDITIQTPNISGFRESEQQIAWRTAETIKRVQRRG